jgi:hypothetical protein
MNTSLNHGSAKIYQFPAGGRSALGGRRYENAKTFTDKTFTDKTFTDKAVTDLASSRVSEVAVGDAWYHDAAIQESKPGRDS